MNSYELSRNFIDFAFENPDKIKPNHYALYFFAIEHCNRLGWKEKFGLPSIMTMEAIGIKSHNTYINTFNDLEEWGLIKVVERSKNQYSANIIALSKFDKALDKALDKAFIKHGTKQRESTDSIDKQINKEQETKNKQLLKDVCDFFNVNEIKNFNTYKAIHTFVMVSGIDPKTFEAYKQYKEQSNEITHGWRTFIGDPENKFSDGAWAACDWSAKIKDIPKSKNGIPEEPDQIWIKKNGQNADLWMEACRKWRANGWQYKQQEGATIKTWKQTNK